MKKIASLTVIAVVMGSAFAANAASTGTITFNGMVTDTTCNVGVDGQGADATVTLPTVAATDLSVAGQTTGRTSFNMSLSDCAVGSEGENTVSAFFQTGATVDNNTGRLKQTTATGAENVSLQLRDGTNNAVIFAGNQNHMTSNAFVTIKDGEEITLPYTVEYYAEGVAKSGVVTSSVVYNLQYK